LPWPAPFSGERWQAALEDLLERERFDLVLPTNDPTLIPVQRRRERFSRLSRLAVPDDLGFEVLFDKIRTHELASSLAIPVARSVTVTSVEQVDAAIAELGLPLVIKPRASYLPEELEERGYVRRARTPDEARKAAEALLIRGDVLVSENVNGSGCGYELLADRGEILMRFQHERVHEPPNGGWSSYRRSVRINPEFDDAARRLMKALRYTGVAMVELKHDRKSGRWVLIEVNARFWGSLPLALAAGADFPAALYELLVTGRRPGVRRYRTNVYARNLRSDLRWLALNATADRDDPALTTTPLPAVATEVTNVLRGREHVDTFVRDDPNPGWAELRWLGAEGLARAISTASVAVSRGSLRRRRRERAQAALAEAESLLFVCRGNICRSPFAARVAQRALGSGKRIRSAGVLPMPDRPSPLVARVVAREHGIDLEDHRSVVLTAEMMAGADLVLVFDESNRHEVVRRFPEARPRVVLLAALDGDRAAIPDPLDSGPTVYRQVYARIAGLLEHRHVAGEASPVSS
jgi:protein-tyrosine-phosphatase/predicted ATP-grasp superfamily ATP-dependent carboligase